MKTPSKLTLLDPTNEATPASRPRAQRLDGISGKRVGLLDISKPLGNFFLDTVEEILTKKGAVIERFAKPTFTKPAPLDLRHKIATSCDAVIEALADWGSCTSCSVHDITDLEERGIPGVFVASSQFIDAAERQSSALGSSVAAVFVAHPIQDRSQEEIHKLATDAAEEIIGCLLEAAPN